MHLLVAILAASVASAVARPSGGELDALSPEVDREQPPWLNALGNFEFPRLLYPGLVEDAIDPMYGALRRPTMDQMSETPQESDWLLQESDPLASDFDYDTGSLEFRAKPLYMDIENPKRILTHRNNPNYIPQFVLAMKLMQQPYDDIPTAAYHEPESREIREDKDDDLIRVVEKKVNRTEERKEEHDKEHGEEYKEEYKKENKEVQEEDHKDKRDEEHTEELEKESKSKEFALTPLDKGYFDPTEKGPVSSDKTPGPLMMMHRRSGKLSPGDVFEEPRQIRQNPNLSRTKTLLAGDSEILRYGNGGGGGGGRPAGAGAGGGDSRAAFDEIGYAPDYSVYQVAIIAAVGAAIAVATLGFAFGWYTLSRKAKAAADVDYPAYGVTGPTADSSGDRKLAHSAHMYHYQHQKQQILAMERNGVEQRSGSITDPESEEENEEGDYTVYECPGFATTGDMEVKNPMFSDDSTLATPGKCEMVKPQPKE